MTQDAATTHMNDMYDFCDAEAEVARGLFDSLTNEEGCECEHCETQVLKRALDTYLRLLSARICPLYYTVSVDE